MMQTLYLVLDYALEYYLSSKSTYKLARVKQEREKYWDHTYYCAGTVSKIKERGECILLCLARAQT